MNRRFALALSFSAALLGCRSTEEKKLQDTPSADDIPFRMTRDSEADVPNFLWSPARRKSSAGYYYLVGEQKLLSGDFKNAQVMFESAYNLDPNPFLAGKLIATDALTGKVEEAMIEARKMVLLYPKSPQLRSLYGQILARRGMYKDAVAEYEIALDLEPTREDMYLELCDLHQMARQISSAIAVAKDLVTKIPGSAKGWSRLAKLYLINGQKKDALGPALKSYEMQSSDPETTLIYALALEANNQSSKAVSLYETLYRQNPANEELIERMVEIYRSMGNLETSLELLTELSKLPGGATPGVALQRAIILWELKRFDDAATLLDKLANDFPEQMRLRYLAGVGQERIKRNDNALKWYNGVPADSEFWGPAQTRIALILKDQKKLDESLAVFKKIETAGKADADTYSISASIYAEQKKYSDAIKRVEVGYEKFPQEHRLMFLKGVYQERSGDIGGCIVTMQRLKEVDPRNSAALNYLGYLYAERGEKLDEAQKLIEDALKIKPNDGYYLDSLAWVWYQRKDYKKALKILQQAQKVIPDEGIVDEHLGDVYLKLGDKALALKYFKAALEKELEDKDKARVQEKFEKLNSELQKKAS